jgi:thymidylate kinase
MMPADAPLIVALDGPSDTGKSTLAHGLRKSLEGDVLVLPCYADFAHERGLCLPPARAADVEQQLAGLASYLDLDCSRRTLLRNAAPETIVIADRSWLGLLAHTYAVERTGGPAAYKRARQLTLARAAELLQPHLTLFLALEPANRRARVEPDEDGAWFTQDAFNEQLNGFFASEASGLSPSTLKTLDALPPRQVVLASAMRSVISRRGDVG